jgi:uncharacterized protein YndB with AHSA1/START domain
MTTSSVTHSSFVIERSYPADPARVFAAFADEVSKSQWAFEPELDQGRARSEFDFRVGGRERFVARVPDGPTYRYDALYYDIVADQRIVYCYEMYADDDRISVSVATIELAKDAVGTALTYTEQGAYLDGLDKAENREAGTAEQLDKLREVLS